MSLLSTSKVRIYSSTTSLEDLLSYLQEKGCVQVVNSQDSEEAVDESVLSRLDFAIRYISPYSVEKKGLRNLVLGERIELSESDARRRIIGFDWEAVVDKVSELEQGRNDLVRALDEKKMMLSVFSSWKDVGVFSPTSSFSPVLLEVPLKDYDLFVADLSSETALYEIEESSRDTRFVNVVCYIGSENVSFLGNLVSSYKGKVIDLPAGESPSSFCTSLAQEISTIEKKMDSNIISTQKLAEEIDLLKIVYDVYLSKIEKVKAVSFSTCSSFVSFVEGWVLSRELKLLQYDLEKEFSDVVLEEVEVKEGEKSPVKVESSPLMQPVQEITGMFGTPGEKELDPTAYYALFFIVFFGFCLTDAGYGLVLMAFTGIILMLKLPFEAPVRNMIRLFFYGGVSTLVLGVLFGGYFGLTPSQVPEFLTYTRAADGNLMFLGQIFDPMKDLVSKIMPLTYILGIFHLCLGLYLSGKIAMNNGNIQKMYWVVLPIVGMFISAALVWGLGIAGLEYLFYTFLFVSFWGLGESGNVVVRLLKGVGMFLVEALSWFSNILSYSRLFALGLATGIIGMAFNIVAITLSSMVPGVGGWAIMIFVLLFGHSLNISLNLLGAYVHASRLQFVEFFGMFLNGGGTIFRPLRKKSRFRVSS